MARILYVITKSNFGGAQRYVRDIAVAARDAGNEVAVAAGGGGILAEELARAGIRVVPLPALSPRRAFLSDLFSFGALFPLIALMRGERPDVVHGNSAKAGGLAALAARLVRVPRIVFTAHGWEFNAPRPWPARAGIRLFSWLSVLLSHTTICVSAAVRRDIAWMPGARRRTVVIRNGIACGALLPRAEARAALAPRGVGRFWIGMISELNPTKRVGDAVRAFASLARAHPDALLVVIGEGSERERLEKIIRETRMRDRVFLAGFRKDAPSLLNAFDLFVHAPRSEALGYAILEAGCASLPVVAARVGGIPEIITDESQGLLVPAEDPGALARAMESLMRDPRRAAECGARLHARVRSAFTKEAMVAETLACYRARR